MLQVKLCSAIEKKGIDKVWDVIEEYRISMNDLNKVGGLQFSTCD